jgi:hypothetical protein
MTLKFAFMKTNILSVLICDISFLLCYCMSRTKIKQFQAVPKGVSYLTVKKVNQAGM